MKKKATVFCLAAALALGTCTVSAANGTQNISATFRNIKIVVDGKTLSTSAEPFIYNGTTYLPIRAVGEAVGKEVTWDGGTNTVYLGEVPADAQQKPAETTPTPAVSGNLPELMAILEAEADSESIAEILEDIHSNPDLIADLYRDICFHHASDGNAKRVEASYAEAQAVFAACTADANELAEVEAAFNDFYQNDVLPML